MRKLILFFLLVTHLTAATSLISSSKGAGATAQGVTMFGNVVSGGTAFAASSAANESDVQFPVSVATTFSKLAIVVSANTLSGSATIRIRKQTAAWAASTGASASASDGSQIVTVNATQTGTIDETTNGGSYHTDHFNAGDLISYEVITASGSGTIVIRGSQLLATPDTTNQTLTRFGGFLATTGFTAPDTFFEALGGLPQNTQARVEDAVQLKFGSAGSLKELCIVVTANSLSATSTFRNRINGANGGLSQTFAAGATGQFCASGTDAIAVNDLVSWAIMPGTASGTGSLTLVSYVAEFVTTDDTALLDVQNSAGGYTVSANTTYYNPVNADSSTNTTPGVYAFQARTAMTIDKMKMYIDANTLTTTDAVVTLWKNNAATALTFNIPAGSQFAWFEDATHSVSVVASDLLEVKIVPSTTGASMKVTAVTMRSTLTATPPAGGKTVHRVISGD